MTRPALLPHTADLDVATLTERETQQVRAGVTPMDAYSLFQVPLLSAATLADWDSRR